jgi:hypothetical protein
MKVYILIIITLVLFSCSDNDNEGVRIKEIGNSPNKIYIKEVTWGLTGDNKLIYISLSNSLKDTVSEMFYKDDYFFYKLEGDTLSTYTMSKSYRNNLAIKPIIHKEIILSNVEMMDLTTMYKNMGLSQLVW